MASDNAVQQHVPFENPFQITDIQVFDHETLHDLLNQHCSGLTPELLAKSLHGIAEDSVERIRDKLPEQQREPFQQAFSSHIAQHEVMQARQQVLDALFWELIYWKKPELYEELTAGEHLHPGIFQRLEPDLHDRIVLDAGAGSGRASFECLQVDAAGIYAVEPSPGLLRILRRKLRQIPHAQRVTPLAGHFDALPLADNSVDVALACSAFTAEPEQGGEGGLAELRRVTRPGGKIVIIWPRREDHDWFQAHGFQHVALPSEREMYVTFRSLDSALRCARLFYAHRPAVEKHLLATQRPEIPFALLDMDPPCDYYWRTLPPEE